MPNCYSVHQQFLLSHEPLSLPKVDHGPREHGLTCWVECDSSLKQTAQKDRNLSSGAGSENIDDRPEEDTRRPVEPDIVEPEGWWGVRTTGEEAPRAGISYSGYLFELTLGGTTSHADVTSRSIQSADAILRYTLDPEVPYRFPLGNCLERMIVPLWLALAYNTVTSIHAGAVVDEHHRAGWMWTGPSGAGKSSIAAAVIARAPFRPCADETAVLRAEGQNGAVTMLPGAPWFRLFEPPEVPYLLSNESVVHKGENTWNPYESGNLPDPINKRWYRFRDELYPRESVPLEKWWLLDPDADVEQPRTESIVGSEAATSLLNETIDFNQRDETWATRRFKNAMAVARRVPAAVVRYDKERHESGDIAELLLSEMKI